MPVAPGRLRVAWSVIVSSPKSLAVETWGWPGMHGALGLRLLGPAGMLAVLRQIHRPGKPHKKREEGFMPEGLHLRPLVGRDEPQQRFIGPADLARDVVAGSPLS